MTIRRITALTDFSAYSDRAIETALELARALGAHLTVLHLCAEVPGGRAPLGSAGLDEGQRDESSRRMQEQLARFDAKGVEIEYEVEFGMHPGTAVLGVLEKSAPDLVVMGTHGRRGMEHVLLGSVAEKCVREAPCPVLTVKAG